MSYYRPNFSQTAAMTRGRGYTSTRGGGYRGSTRGSSTWGTSPRGGYNPTRGSGSSGRFSTSFNSSFDSRSKYGSSDRYTSRPDEFRKPYRPDGSRYSGGSGGSNEYRGSPDRKRMRTESLSSRHDGGYGGSGDSYGRYDSSGAGGYLDRRSFSSDRRSSFSRREEFRKPAPPLLTSSPRGGYRGRISSRGSMRSRLRERPTRRRLIESSYVVRRRTLRPSDYPRRLKVARMRSAVIRRTIKKSKSDNEESGNEKEDVDKEKKQSEKDEKEEEKEGDEGNDEDKDTPKKIKTEEGEEKKESDTDDKSPMRKKYIKLECPHCQTKRTTFGKYSIHLQSARHISAMRRVALKQKAILSRMRLMQRNAQRELEKTTDDLASRTSFCPLCKLNYRQPKLTHQASEAHKNMKKFLMPYCKVCEITFKSPMLYESHCCSIDHIKRKAMQEDKSDKEEGSGVDDNLENFMTIDSVGDMDEEEREKKKDTEDPSKPKEQINVGIEHIKKVEVYYCDLCSMYLPRRDEADMPKKIAEHCKQRTHLRRYVSYKEDKELAKRAERLQRRETMEKEKEKEKEETKTAEESPKKDAVVKENGEASLNEDEGEEKLWADVDKDLGIILAEAESGNKSSDEDEDDSVANGGRYDRFKTGEKNVEEKKLTDDVKEEEEEEEAMEPDVSKVESEGTEAK